MDQGWKDTLNMVAAVLGPIYLVSIIATACVIFGLRKDANINDRSIFVNRRYTIKDALDIFFIWNPKDGVTRFVVQLCRVILLLYIVAGLADAFFITSDITRS